MFAKTTADLEADWAKEPVCNFPARQSRGGRLVIAELAERLRRSCSNDTCRWDRDGDDAGKARVSSVPRQTPRQPS